MLWVKRLSLFFYGIFTDASDFEHQLRVSIRGGGEGGDWIACFPPAEETGALGEITVVDGDN